MPETHDPSALSIRRLRQWLRKWFRDTAGLLSPLEVAGVLASLAWWELADRRASKSFSRPLDHSELPLAERLSELGERAEAKILAQAAEAVNALPETILQEFHTRFLKPDGLNSILLQDLPGLCYETAVGTIRTAANTPAKAVGVVYTPRPVARFMARESLQAVLQGDFSQKLQHLHILDPACGCGMFLIVAWEELCERFRRSLLSQAPASQLDLLVPSEEGWILTDLVQQRLWLQHLWGIDLDATAVEYTRTTLKLLTGWTRDDSAHDPSPAQSQLNLLQANTLTTDFSALADSGMQREYDLILGNPPYCRERDAKPLFDEVCLLDWARKVRSPRMDYWYFFLHRGLELLRPAGRLCYVTPEYWLSGSGAEKLIEQFRTQAHLEELLVLGNSPLFPDITGRHTIFRVQKSSPNGRSTRIQLGAIEAIVPSSQECEASCLSFLKPTHRVLANGRVNILPDSGRLLEKLNSLPILENVALIRQGIAENPARISRRVNQRFGNLWQEGTGVFVLSTVEVEALALSAEERSLLKPYHRAMDVERYSLRQPAELWLINSTPQTWPELELFPRLARHLEPFRPIMEARRETRLGKTHWWNLHWPREAALWQADKILAVQMADRPKFAAVQVSTWVPFSVNVVVPQAGQDLFWLTAVLNSRLVWAWAIHHAKRRGIGLELNGHTLRRIPLPSFDMQKRCRLELEELVRERRQLSPDSTSDSRDLDELEAELNRRVNELYELNDAEIGEIDEIIQWDRWLSSRRVSRVGSTSD